MDRKHWIKYRNTATVWVGCLMGLICGILIAMVAARLYMNEIQRAEWSSQAVEARQTSVHLYGETQKNGMQVQVPGARK